MADTAPLPVPNQLKAQLQKCKTVRSADVRETRIQNQSDRIGKALVLDGVSQAAISSMAFSKQSIGTDQDTLYVYPYAGAQQREEV